MRSVISTAATLASFAATVRAGATLADFQPLLTDLTGACATIYHTNIQRCSGSDFSGSGCSTNCIAGLTALSPAVQGACASAGVTGNNVIVAFLNGVGVTNLCPNAPGNPPISSKQQTTTSQQQTSTQAPSTSDTPSTTSTTSTPDSTSSTSSSTTSTTPSSISTSSSSASSSSSISSSGTSSSSSVSSSSPGFVFSPTTSTSSTASQTSSTMSSSTSIGPAVAGSGGGSPFDTPGPIGAASSVVRSLGLLVSTALGALILIR